MMSSSSIKQLPVPALYHMRNYSSDRNWLAYQVSINQVRLLKFNQSLSIQQSFVYQFTSQPIKQIKLVYNNKQNKVYVAILFLTRYVVYEGNNQLCSYRIKLDKNIVVFQNSFVSCDGINNQKEIYFTFLTANGDVHILPVDNIQMKSCVNIYGQSRFCTIKILDNLVVLGNQKGKLFLADLNTSSVIKNFDTGSNLPILQIGLVNKRVIAITCQGQIFNIAQNFTAFTSVSAHQAFVPHLQINNNKVFTFGDDCILNVFQVDKNSGDLKIRNSQKHFKRANMVFKLFNTVFVNFYQQTSFEEINVK